MESDKFKRIEEIYHAALEIPKGEIASFLKEVCREDENLRREVESLLSFDKVKDSFIDATPEELAAEFISERENPQMIDK